MGGRHLDSFLNKILFEKGYEFTTPLELELISEIKETGKEVFANSELGKKTQESSEKLSDEKMNRKIVSGEKNVIVRELSQIVKNKLDGCNREQEVRKDLEKKYPHEQGYSIISEAYLRDKNGNIVKDPETGKARRIDFVVVKDGKVVDSIEVTGPNVDKTRQMEQEQRVKNSGGIYIRDKDGNLIKNNVQTRIERRD